MELRHLPGLWLAWLAGLGLLAGLSIWALFIPDRAAMMANHLESGDRVTALVFGLACGLLALLHAALTARGRGSIDLRTLDATARELAGIWGIAVIGPILVWLADPQLARTRPALVLFAIAAVTAAAIFTSYRLTGERVHQFFARRVLTTGMCRLTALGLTGLVAYALIDLALTRHVAMQTNTYDLGIFVNIIANSARGDLLDCGFFASGTHMSEHFDPVLILLAPLHWWWPGAAALLVFQALWLCGGAYPVYRLARHHLGHPGYGLVFVIAYTFFPAIHANALWDVHSLSLGAPLWLWLWWAATRRGETPGWDYWLWFCLLLCVREEFAFVGLLIAFVWLLEGRRRLGLQTLALALIYAATVHLWVAPSAGIEAHAARYRELLHNVDGGLLDAGLAVVANPAFALSYALSLAKVLYTLALLAPFAYLSLAGGRALLPAAFGLVFIGLSSSGPVFHPYFHYTSLIYPAVMLAAIMGYTRITRSATLPALGLDPRRVRAALGCGVVVAACASSWCFGALNPAAPFLAGFKPIERHPDAEARARVAAVGDLVNRLPTGATIAASGYIGPHIAHLPGARRFFEQGDDPREDYLLLWVDRFKPKLRQRVDRLVTTGTYHIDVQDHGIWLLRRDHVASLAPPLQ